MAGSCGSISDSKNLEASRFPTYLSLPTWEAQVARAAQAARAKGLQKETQEESVEYLDVEIVLTGQSEMRLETGIYRKEAAANMYIQANSAHP